MEDLITCTGHQRAIEQNIHLGLQILVNQKVTNVVSATKKRFENQCA